jgi:hypothetical protein
MCGYFDALVAARCCACRRIAAAIEEAGLKGKVSPLDYLQFFCLGKREATGTTCAVRPAENVPAVEYGTAARLMVEICCKLRNIVTDVLVSCGI